MPKFSVFQGVLMGVFIVALIGGVLLFSRIKSNEGANIAELTMWGTMDAEIVNSLFSQIYNQSNDEISRVTYFYKDPATFDTEFLEALASGTGPDLLLLPHEDIFKQRKRLYAIPYKAVPIRDYKDIFVQQGELFLTNDGVIAIPFALDPLVMYWNRTMFNQSLIAKPPVYWDELVALVSKLSVRDSGGTLKKSAIALGEFSNVSYAKDIMSLLLMQAGSPIVGIRDNRLTALIDEKGIYTVAPSDTAITFFIQFSNPVKSYYSWSRSFPNSIDHFAAGDVAMLIAKASDIKSIQAKNINLDFDVAELPIPRGEANGAITFGSMYGVGIVKNSPKTSAAIGAAMNLATPEVWAKLEAVSGLAPVRRDVVSTLPEDPYQTIFYNAAQRSRAWFDPDKIKTETIFRNMVESVVSGRQGASASAKVADDEMNNLLDTLFVE